MTTNNKAFIIKDDLVVDSSPGRQLVIPVGDNTERPGEGGTPAPLVGAIRYNTSSEIVEVWNGSNWQAASIAGEAVTQALVQETSIVNAIIFG